MRGFSRERPLYYLMASGTENRSHRDLAIIKMGVANREPTLPGLDTNFAVFTLRSPRV